MMMIATFALIVPLLVSVCGEEVMGTGEEVVMVSHSGLPGPLRVQRPAVRVRRTVDTSKKALTEDERKEFVHIHNKFRSEVSPSASNMRKMSWSSELEAMAQEWANSCNWKHGHPEGFEHPYGYAGQNLWIGTGGYTPTGSVTSWNSEVSYYTYPTNACSNVCGHYTQVVWASSYAVGCGIAFCPEVEGLSFKNAYYVVCNYGPGGNYQGQKPYTSGQFCSNCPAEASTCSNNLCTSAAPCGAMKCENGGTLDTDTCVCDCPPGLSGATCSAASWLGHPNVTHLIVMLILGLLLSSY